MLSKTTWCALICQRSATLGNNYTSWGSTSDPDLWVCCFVSLVFHQWHVMTTVLSTSVQLTLFSLSPTSFLEELFPSLVLAPPSCWVPGIVMVEGWAHSQAPKHKLLEPGGRLTREESPLVSPLAVLLITAEGVTSSSVGDFVRGGTMPTAKKQSSQWASWEAWRQGAWLSGEACSCSPPRLKAQGSKHCLQV